MEPKRQGAKSQQTGAISICAGAGILRPGFYQSVAPVAEVVAAVGLKLAAWFSLQSQREQNSRRDPNNGPRAC